jgi:hypothetical protein
MNPETPAVGVSVAYRDAESESIRVECDCSSAEHSVLCWMEIEPEENWASATIYVETTTPYNTGFWQRIRMCWRILTQGYYKLEHNILLKEQALTTYIAALERTRTRLEEYRTHRSIKS